MAVWVSGFKAVATCAGVCIATGGYAWAQLNGAPDFTWPQALADIPGWLSQAPNPSLFVTTLISAFSGVLGVLGFFADRFAPKPYSEKQGREDRAHVNASFAKQDERAEDRHDADLNAHAATQDAVQAVADDTRAIRAAVTEQSKTIRAVVAEDVREVGNFLATDLLASTTRLIETAISPGMAALGAMQPLLQQSAADDAAKTAGWTIILRDELDRLPPLSQAEAVRYFDGAVPSLRHAMSPLIPRLSHADALVSILDAAAGADDKGGSLQLLRAAGGEGKSTALLQAAVHAAREGGWAVLLRQSSDVRLNPELIDQLSPDQRWLIVADDAEGLVEDVWKAAEKLNQSGSRHVMFLLAARDTDWRNAKGDKKPWATRLGKRDDLVLGKLSAEDAGRVVDAWSALGDDGLRALKNVDGRDAKISRLLKSASSGAARTGEGSFFGGLLDTRFGAEGLVGHMTILLESLKAAPIDGGNKSLYDALVYIANAHAVRKMPGIDNKVLAALCGVARHRVSTAIINPLGREIGAAQSHGFALTRHPRVADAIVIAANNMGTDLGQVWSAMVATTVTMCTNPGDTSPQYFNYMMHCAGKLMKDLPQPILQETRGAAGIDTGHMTMRVRPKRVDAITNCARAYRVAGFPSQAFDLMKTNFPNLKEKGDDWGYNVRGYFLEWGVCSGNLKTRQGSAMGAWLAAFALSDALAVELELDTAMKVCTGIGVSMLALQDDKPDGIFSLGARAATKLGWQTSPDDRAHGNLLRHETEINKRGTKLPADNAESINWLIGAARAAWDEIKDRDLRNLKNDGQLRFEKLRALLAAPAVPRRR